MVEKQVCYHMWKNLGEWFGALLVTAAMAVSVFGAAEWIENRAAVVPVAGEKAGFTVVVDAGHGGTDGGAVGTDSGVREAALNLMVAKRVQELLEEEGVSVIMTRTGDCAIGDSKEADMQRRKELLNGANVDIAVSVHMNHFTDRSISGAMAYYMTGSKDGQRLAQTVIDAVCNEIGRDRRLANPGDYFVLRECACPAVLVECGFLSNGEDEKLLQDNAHQEKLAKGIVSGLITYLKN